MTLPTFHLDPEEMSEFWKPKWWRLRDYWYWRTHQQPEHFAAAMRMALIGEHHPFNIIAISATGANEDAPHL